MKKIIPFKKELEFNSKISEITSISLEHTLNLKEESIISGEFVISGDYKMTDISINKETFEFVLPFDIALDSRYDVNDVNIDIDDFYYEIINNDTLKVNIDVFIEGEIKEEPVEEITLSIDEPDKEVEEGIREEFEEERCIDEDDEIEPSITYESVAKESLEVNEEENMKNENININYNIFDNVEDQETYATYHVYIVKEDDTLDKIISTYKITKEDLENYNNIGEIKVGDKLIIPSPHE